MPEIAIQKGYTPGSIGRVVELHGRYYHQNWDFGLFFEVKVARDLSEFVDRYDDRKDGLWLAVADDTIQGAIAIDGSDPAAQGAHLRWFIVSDALRGRGLGNRLLKEALAFCKNRGYKRVYLWTFKGLQAARHLYEKYGFELLQENQGSGWGTSVNEQRFELLFSES